jgi:hypothetical protein
MEIVAKLKMSDKVLFEGNGMNVFEKMDEMLK